MSPNSFLAAILFAIGLFAAGAMVGWETRGNREDAKTLAKLEQLNRDLDSQRTRADKLSEDLAKEQLNIKTVTIETIKEIPKVTTVYVERTGDAPKIIPPAVITNGTVSLYNYSLTAGLPANSTTGKLAYTPPRTDITRANVDIADILAVHAENAAKWADCRSQLNKLIDFELGDTPHQ